MGSFLQLKKKKIDEHVNQSKFLPNRTSFLLSWFLPLSLNFEKAERNVRKKKTESTYLKNRTLRKKSLEQGSLQFFLISVACKILTDSRKNYCFSLGINANFLCYYTINVKLAYKYTYILCVLDIQNLSEFFKESSFLQDLKFVTALIFDNFCTKYFHLSVDNKIKICISITRYNH